MNLKILCKEINLQSEIQQQVMAFAAVFDFDTVSQQLRKFLIYEKMTEARIELQNILGEDENNIKILSCMLKASADAYQIYKEKGISDEIYFSTMKCYTRFIDETYKMTGKLSFDRCWWTTRQAGCHLFRIGDLEYEMKHLDDQIVIGLHIPSNADFSPSAVDQSLQNAKDFFAAYDPYLSNAEYRCHSWLLDSQLKKMLNKSSNILHFQDRFDIFDKGETSTEFIQWLFRTNSTEYAALPENTSLQKNMKKHLLSGGIIRNAYGRVTYSPHI